MKVLIDGKQYDLTPDNNGFVSVTFTKQDKSPISIGALENCAGTTVIDEIQLEQNAVATSYEDPALIQGEATGLIKDIRGLEYAINDPVNGLRSQLTILAQGFEAEVADAVGNYSVQGQTIDGLFSEIKSIDGNLNQLVRNAEGNNQLISSLQDDVAQNRLDYHSLKETADSYERIIGSNQADFENNVSRAVQTSGLIQQEVASLTSGLSTTVSQLEDSWALQLKDGNDLKTALNATTDGLRLKGDLIHLDGTTYVDGDFWAKEINSIQINADNIVSGEIDASKIRVVNLDVNSLTGNKSEFIQTSWNDIEGSIRIDGRGLLSTAGDNSQVYLQNGIVGIRNPEGASIGQIGYKPSGGSPQMTLHTTDGSHFSLTQRLSGTDVQTIFITAGGSEYHNNAERAWFNASTVNIEGELRVNNAKDIRMGGGIIVNPYGINFMYGGSLYTLSGGGATRLEGSSMLSQRVNDVEKMRLDTTRNYMYQPLNMQGNGILQQSDIRLKHNVQTMRDNNLDKIVRLRLVNYEWLNPERAKGAHKGLIAQEVQEIYPELVSMEPDGNLAINQNELAMAHLHAFQQHVAQTNDKVVQLEQKIASLQKELALLKGA